MIDLDYLHMMAQYNRWMNEKLYASCAQLSDAQRRADRGAFFKSVHGTLLHLLMADLLWMRRLRGIGLEGLQEELALHDEFAALSARRAAADAELLTWLGGLDPAALTMTLSWHSQAYGRTFTHPRWQLLVHFFNHQTHHRGQLTTLLMQYGIDPGATDLTVSPGCFADLPH